MAQRLRTHTIVAKNMGSVPNSYIAAYEQFQGIQNIHVGKSLIHIIKINIFFKVL